MEIINKSIDKNNPYLEKLFTKGFLGCIGEPLSKINDSWEYLSFTGDVHIAFDKDIPFTIANGESSYVFVLGYIINIDVDSIVHKDIVNYLYGRLKKSEKMFFEAIDKCCGRFICIYKQGENVNIINDATGNRAIYYCQSEKIFFSSHSKVLAWFLCKPSNIDVQEYLIKSKPNMYNVAYLPGLTTIYQDISMLCPNTKLNLLNGKIERYYPNQTYQTLDSKYVIDIASKYIKNFADKWARAYKLTISLTAGIDSRLTLSAFKNLKDSFDCFTYTRVNEKVNVVDSIIAEKIAIDNCISHTNIIFDYEHPEKYIDSMQDYKSFSDVIKNNVEFEHFFPLAYQYMHHFKDERLHIRSNLGELLRCWYYFPPIKNVIAENGSVLSNFVNLHKMRTKNSDHLFAYKAFEEYIEKTSILGIKEPLHLYNLLYWEQSLGMWQSSLLSESDSSHDTVNIFNCRYLIDLFFHLSEEDLSDNKCMIGIISKLWPELLEYPINPKLEDLYLDDIDWIENSKIIKELEKSFGIIVLKTEIVEEKSIYKFLLWTNHKDVEFAFYLYKNKEKIDCKMYSKENYYELNTIEPGEYSVKWFVVDDFVLDKGREPIGENKQSGIFSKNITIKNDNHEL